MKPSVLVTLLFSAAFASAPELKPPTPDDQYKLGPDSQPQEGVPQGKVEEFTLADSKTFPGFTRKWWLYVPAQYDGKTPCALMVFQDGGGYAKRDGAWRRIVIRIDRPSVAARTKQGYFAPTR